MYTLYVNLNTRYALQTNTTSLIRLSSLTLAIKLTMIILTQELASAVATTLTLEILKSWKSFRQRLEVLTENHLSLAFLFLTAIKSVHMCHINFAIVGMTYRKYVLIAKYATQSELA